MAHVGSSFGSKVRCNGGLCVGFRYACFPKKGDPNIDPNLL